MQRLVFHTQHDILRCSKQDCVSVCAAVRRHVCPIAAAGIMLDKSTHAAVDSFGSRAMSMKAFSVCVCICVCVWRARPAFCLSNARLWVVTLYDTESAPLQLESAVVRHVRVLQYSPPSLALVVPRISRSGKVAPEEAVSSHQHARPADTMPRPRI